MLHNQKMLLLFLHNSKELFISPACNQYDDDNDNIKCMWTLIVHRIYCRDSIQQSIWRAVNTLRLIPALAPGVITNLASTGVPLLGPSAPFSRAVCRVCGLQSIENVVKQRELVPANEDIVADNWCVVWIDLPTYSPHVRNWSCQTGTRPRSWYPQLCPDVRRQQPDQLLYEIISSVPTFITDLVETQTVGLSSFLPGELSELYQPMTIFQPSTD